MNIDFPSELVAAFAGAFFAFLFIRLADALSRLYDRQIRHCAALGRIEQTMNLLLDAIGSNQYIIKSILDGFQKSLAAGNIPFAVHKPQPLPTDWSCLIDLLNVSVLNDCFDASSLVTRLNHDIVGLNTAYDTFSSAFLNDDKHKDTYLRNASMYAENLDDLLGHLARLETKTKRLAAAVRVRYQRDRPIFARFQHWLLVHPNEADFERAVRKRVAELEGEIAHTQAISTREIMKAANKAVEGMAPR